MKEQFANYEIALKLKELGFDEECFGYYHINEGYNDGYAFCYSENTRTSDCSILAPLWQQVVDFLKIKGVLVTELWDGWEYGIEDCGFKYCRDKTETILKAIELCKELH